MASHFPVGLKPELIGHIVKIQAFKREEPDGDTIDLDSMEQYVGTLIGYYGDKNCLIVQFNGAEPRLLVYKEYLVEVFKHS